ncbi:glycosyltransferase [Agromyces sp. Marseille-Q5079]|uniref:glycosyltransferase n=1 Tax=Agromyces sp. Marseille-Q5079 TaxID=3439059 RepID=UPI003D9C87C4
MKVALLAESFLPHMNGVTHSLLQVLRHLDRRGHDALVIAPGPGAADGAFDEALHGARTVFVPSVPLPSYPDVRVALAGAHRLAGVLRAHGSEVVHLASPFVLGWRGIAAAETIGVPSVAVYQTDVPGYAERYGVPGAAPALARHLARLHSRATLTLAPSTSAVERLTALGVEPDRVALWRRGVDTDRFAPGRRSGRWRRDVAGAAPDEVVVGYVGRLAPEKQVEDLRALVGLPRTRLVVVGDGPSRAPLERMLPTAVFTGFLDGDALAEAMAGFDVFVHPGENETFCQTVQEALASGVPVVAVGRGGPLDLVENSIDGWLYRPGDLAEFRARVLDLVGDDAKRRAFAVRAREAVRGRGWDVLGDELLGHYDRAAIANRRATAPAGSATSTTTPAPATPAPATSPAAAARVPMRQVAASAPPAPPRWQRYVAVGDSLSEGLCDTSRMVAGEYRGWADRLAMLLALASPHGDRVAYANVAVRSRKVADAVGTQVPLATSMRADLVSVFIGANDLVGPHPDVHALADRLGGSVAALRATGADVLLVTPFLPQRPASRLYRGRFGVFADRLRGIARETGAILLDVAVLPELTATDMWAEDRVHLNSAGHRALAYAAARALGVPDAAALGALEQAAHEDPEDGAATAIDRQVGDLRWLASHAAPWIGRRLRGRTAGDGRESKRPELLPVLAPAASPVVGDATSAVHRRKTRPLLG